MPAAGSLSGEAFRRLGENKGGQSLGDLFRHARHDIAEQDDEDILCEDDYISRKGRKQPKYFA